MALTEKQKNNVYKMSYEDLAELVAICEEKLGLVSQTYFVQITAYQKNRKSLNNDMDTGKVKYKMIGNIKFPCVNWTKDAGLLK